MRERMEGTGRGHVPLPNMTGAAELAESTDRSATIAALNDAFRQTLRGGWLMLTRGVAAMPEVEQWQLIALVQAPLVFVEGNDPHGEHDFGVLDYGGTVFFWKIDAYDLYLRFASPNPADPAVTARVMTVMRADEY